MPSRQSVETLFHQTIADDSGAGLAEYALLLLLIAITTVGALTGLAGTVIGLFQQASGSF